MSLTTLSGRPHADAGTGCEAEDDPPRHILAAEFGGISIPALTENVSVRELFQDESALGLAELPREFFDTFGKLVMPARAAQCVVQYVATRRVDMGDARLQFEAPCHLDCYVLSALLKRYRELASAQGGLSVGDPSFLPRSNFLLLDDGTRVGTGVMLEHERRKWHLYVQKPYNPHRFVMAEGSKFYVPRSAAAFLS